MTMGLDTHNNTLKIFDDVDRIKNVLSKKTDGEQFGYGITKRGERSE